MDEDKEKLAERLEEAKSIALDVEDGRRSRYWKHLERKLEGLIATRQKYLDITNEKLLTDVVEINKRNQTVIERNFLRDLLTINQVIIDENLSIIGANVKPRFENKRLDNFIK